MVSFVQREVSELAEDPSPSGEAILLVGYTAGSSDVKRFVTSEGGEVLESLPYRSLRVKLPETSLEGLLNQSSVETVELDSGMETLQGN